MEHAKNAKSTIIQILFKEIAYKIPVWMKHKFWKQMDFVKHAQIIQDLTQTA